jgi:hypothetical protein
LRAWSALRGLLAAMTAFAGLHGGFWRCATWDNREKVVGWRRVYSSRVPIHAFSIPPRRRSSRPSWPV